MNEKQNCSKDKTDIKFLFRYQRMPKHRRRLINLFVNNEFYFPSPKTFNDPFDSKVHFSFEGCNDGDFKNYFIKSIAVSKPHYSSDEIELEVNRLLEKGVHNKNEWRNNLRDIAYKLLQPDIDKLGVFCLSEKRDDILMWSHYTDGHKGFCLQFDKVAIDSSSLYCKPVVYTDKYLTFKEVNDSIPNNKEKQLEVLLRKSKHWDYECEWRIIEQPETRTDEPGNRNYKLPNGMLTGIIFGCEMLPDDKDTIKFLLKNRINEIKLYQAKKRENEFVLEIAETD